MAHQTRTRVDLAAWGSGAVPASQFDHLDQKGFQSINGDDGGVWAPAAVIEIGGEGILMSGPFECTDDATFSGQVVFEGDADPVFNVGATFNSAATFNADVIIGNASGDAVQVNSTASFLANATFAHDVTVGTNDLDMFTCLGESDFSGDAVFHGDVRVGVGTGEELEVDADSIFTGTVDITGDTLVTGNFEVNGTTLKLSGATDLEFTGTSRIIGTPTLSRRLLFDQTGRVPRRTAVGADAGASYSPTSYDEVYLPANTLTAGRTYIISDTNCSDGDHITFTMRDETAGRVLSIETPGNTDNVSLVGSGAPEGEPRWATYVRISGSWRCVAGYFADKS